MRTWPLPGHRTYRQRSPWIEAATSIESNIRPTGYPTNRTTRLLDLAQAAFAYEWLEPPVDPTLAARSGQDDEDGCRTQAAMG